MTSDSLFLDDEPLRDFDVVGDDVPSLHPVRGTPARVVVVHTHAPTRRLYRRALLDAGYDVASAATLRTALVVVRSRASDAAVVEPALAAALRARLRDDVLTAEVRVVAARGREVVGDVQDALARRFGVLACLGPASWGPLADVGLPSLLEAACALRLRGALTVDRGTRTWRVFVDDGVIAGAYARDACDDAEARDAHDVDALVELLDVGDAPWSFDACDVAPRTLGLPWSSLSDALRTARRAGRRARRRSRVASPGERDTLAARP